MLAPLRIGAVAYLNTRPLVHGLEGKLGAPLVFDHPSRLADALAAGTLDVALIPSIEYLRGAGRGYRVVPGIAIAARGSVLSVKLFCRVRPDQIRRLALDASSRTSQVLSRVWLADAMGVRPETIEELPLGVSPLESTADAVLLIGDPAMRADESAFAEVVDLAGAWVRMTELPFVFATWVVRPGIDVAGLTDILHDCRAAGLGAIAEIVATHAPRLGLDEAVCRDYLTRKLSYDLGPREIAGLVEFRDRAARLGLAPAAAELAFLEDHRDLATRR